MIDLNKFTYGELELIEKLAESNLEIMYRNSKLTTSPHMAKFYRERIDILTVLKVKIMNIRKNIDIN